MLKSFALVMCAGVAFALYGATANLADPVGGGPPIQLEPPVLKGACSARDDFAKVIKDIHGDPEEASYLRDVGNYGVTIEMIDAERLRVTFDPVPRTQDEISMGGGAVYLVDRRTGNLT